MSETHSELSSKIVTEKHVIGDHSFILHPYGGMYWEHHKILIVSDTHFGKVMHFRKNGIAVPMGAIGENWEKLDSMIRFFHCKKIIFLGDLFHSEENIEWDHFKSLLNVYSGIDFVLVRGNHDILEMDRYIDAGIEIVESLHKDGLLFSHHPVDSSYYVIHGHIHPAVVMQGKGLGKKKISCFYFCEKYGILPAFGSFTGTMRVEVNKQDDVYLIVGQKVISV